MFLLIQAIPCILHMEIRVGIKILLTMLMIEVLSNANGKLLYTDIQAEGMVQPRASHGEVGL